MARGGRELGQARAARSRARAVGRGRLARRGAGRGPARAASLSSPFRTSKHEEILMWEQIH